MNILGIWFIDMINVLINIIAGVYPLIIAFSIIADVFITKFITEQGEKREAVKRSCVKNTFLISVYLLAIFWLINR